MNSIHIAVPSLSVVLLPTFNLRFPFGIEVLVPVAHFFLGFSFHFHAPLCVRNGRPCSRGCPLPDRKVPDFIFAFDLDTVFPISKYVSNENSSYFAKDGSQAQHKSAPKGV
eukprot:768516-Hanusia_phi.AAC.5